MVKSSTITSKVLVTGGCGYIGSHTIISLINAGHEVVSVDNFHNSLPEVFDAIEKITGVRVKNYPYDLKDELLVGQLFEEEPDIQSVIHFAAFKAVGESTEIPVSYFKKIANIRHNVLVLTFLVLFLDAMRGHAHQFKGDNLNCYMKLSC